MVIFLILLLEGNPYFLAITLNLAITLKTVLISYKL